jgi:hypothetical protein
MRGKDSKEREEMGMGKVGNGKMMKREQNETEGDGKGTEGTATG